MATTPVNEARTAPPITAPAKGTDLAKALCREYLQAILAGQRKSALEIIMDAYRGGYPIPGIYMDVFQEALYEIGRLWESNHISVADEHLGTAITQYVMSNLYQHLEISDERRGKFIITGVQGELHQVGANMVADVLDADGWDTVFLGTNVPGDGVIQSLRQHRARLLGVSSTMVFNLPKVVALVEAVRREYGNSVQIMLGGSAFKTVEALPRELDGCTIALNLQEVLDRTREFGIP